MWRLNVDPAAHFEQLPHLVEEARPVIERSGDPAAVAVLEYAVAQIAFTRTRFGAAFTALTRAMEHASKAGNQWFEKHMLGYAAACLPFGPAPVGDVLTWLEQARTQTAAYEPIFDVQMVAALAQAGRFEEARALSADTIAQMNERGMLLWAAAAMQGPWLTEMLAGDPIEAERLARQGYVQLEKLGERGWLSTQACQLADALYELGRYKEAGQWARRGLDLGSEDDLATQVAGLSVRSRLLAREGDNVAAVALAHRVEELAKTSDSPIAHGDAALNLAEILSLTGDRAGAGRAVRRAVSCYQRKGATAFSTRAQRAAAAWGLRPGASPGRNPRRAQDG
jgi:tetratricopeptide (TPR) repeat protein